MRLKQPKSPKISNFMIRKYMKQVLRTMKWLGNSWTCDESSLDLLEDADNHSKVREEARVARMYIGLIQLYRRVASDVVDHQIQNLLKAALKGSDADLAELSIRASRKNEQQAKLAYGYLVALRAWEK